MIIRDGTPSVIDTFTQAAPAVMHWPWRSAMFKTRYRNDGTYARPGIHRPRGPDKHRLDTSRWFDGNGDPLPNLFRTKRLFSNFGRDNYGLVQLNHYPLGAMESFILKADRGRTVHADHLLGIDNWVERNFNTETDMSVKASKSLRDAELAMLRSDPVLVSLQETAVAWRKARFDTLMQQEPFRALFGRLLMAPESVPVTRKAAQFIARYANLARNTAKM